MTVSASTVYQNARNNAVVGLNNGDDERRNRLDRSICARIRAQELNNKVASNLLGEDGSHCEQAIVYLVSALELTKRHLFVDNVDDTDALGDSADTPQCTCNNCSLGTCLAREDTDAGALKEELQVAEELSPSSFDDHDNSFNHYHYDDTYNTGFLYRKPIFMHRSSTVEECRNVGVKLMIIIMFNLALAHQLKASTIAINMSPNDTRAIQDRMLSLQKAAHLYQLLHYSLQMHENLHDRAGLRLRMLVLNNLAEVHRFAGEPTKSTVCLEHLLHSMMYVLHGVGKSRLDGHGNDRDGGEQQDLFESDEIDGFFRNIQASPIIAKDCICANAA
mmetsp:Transcript_73/g.185  ORF Transcript_73/g.185 Transcript_73/m.185 type:complete len:333 (-) Transcript_73:419-1417(-)|eukprot:CAMPEP_0168166068 /NCGR_PEP_ID=MMETSP0139_2-20121125/1823_1 /TAXON_ID=44445 /ORGANISM="Pseudo-nitzschia australis, Strain 10249 10 AB" /LENGTH=332 /DNA_ID=CAMNT_0008083227 /DNA_START=160 /DNA_END=1158 /DNA_ORIENTATION=+